VSRKEASQIYGVVLPECLTSPEMKESKAYKTYLGYATSEVPPKVARKFKKASPSKKESELVPGDEEPIKKGKRLKTPAKKSASKPATGIVIKEPLVETKSKRKEKEKVDVAHGKGIELLSKKVQIKEVRKKSLRDFHKTHLSGSSMVAEKPPSVEKITPTVTSEGTDDSNNEQESSDESSKQENESEEQESDSEQDEESDNDDQEEEEFDQENKSKDDEMKSDEEQGMDDITDQFDDDADARLEEPFETATGIVQGTDTEMTEAQQENENLETTQEQVVEDTHVTISTVTKKTEKSCLHLTFMSTMKSQDLKLPLFFQYQFPLSLNHHRTSALEKEVAELKKDLLHTQEVSNFTPLEIKKLFHETRDEVTLAKASSQPQSTYEATSTLIEFELKNILLDKMKKSESYLTAPEHQECYDGLKKSYALNQDFFYSYDMYTLKCGRKDKDKDEDPSAGSDQGLKRRKTSKDAEPTTDPKKKDSTSGSSKGIKSQPRSSGKSVQSEEPRRGHG
ncbi:hypothetical protein Tco_1469529, partial [Tanacetum coccineum]